MMDLSDYTGVIKTKEWHIALYHGSCFAHLDEHDLEVIPTLEMTFTCDMLEKCGALHTYQVTGYGAISILETACDGFLQMEKGFGKMTVHNAKLEIGTIATPFKPC